MFACLVCLCDAYLYIPVLGASCLCVIVSGPNLCVLQREKSMLTTVTFNAVGVDMFSATVQDPRTRRTVQVDVTAAQMHVSC